MMKTIAELVQEHEQASFVGREAELTIFTILLQEEALQRPLLNLFGLGGVGKSSLLGEFMRVCSENNVPAAYSDFRAQGPDFRAILQTMRDQLVGRSEAANFAFKPFDGCLDRLAKLEAQVAKNFAASHPLVAGASTDGVVAGASGLVGGALGALLGPVGAYGGLVLGAAAGKAAMQSWGQGAISRLVAHGLSRDDARFFVDLVGELTNTFVDAANGVALDAGKVVLMLDTYEDMTPGLDEWVRELLIPRLSAQVLVVIAGRDRLIEKSPNWQRYGTVMIEKELLKFTVPEATAYLRNAGIHDPGLVDKILSYTERLPWALALLTDINRTGGELSAETIEDDPHIYTVGHRVVSRLISQIKGSAMETLLDLCTVARRFDLDLVKSIYTDFEKDAIYDDLRKYSFVRVLSDGSLAFHDIVRSFLVLQLRANKLTTFKDLNDRLCRYYKERLSQPESKLLLKRDAVEYLYHGLRADEDRGIEACRSLLKQLDVVQQFDLRDALLSEVADFEFHRRVNQRWSSYCKAFRLMNRGEWESAKKLLFELETAPGPDALLRCLILETLGDLLIGQGSYTRAVSLFEESSQLHRSVQATAGLFGLGQTLSKLSEGYAIIGKYSRAKAKAHENLELCRSNQDALGEAWALKSLGDIYRLWGKTQLAIESLEDSLKIFEEKKDDYGTATVFVQLGRVYAHSGEWKKAELVLKEALARMEVLGVEYCRANAMLFLGNVARLKREWLKAEGCYRDALAMHRKMDSKREIAALLGSLGSVCCQLGRLEEAEQHLVLSREMKRAQDYTRGVAVTSVYLGDLRFRQGRFDAALTEYEAAGRLADKSSSHFHRVQARVRMAGCLRAMEQTNRLNAMVTEAARLARRYKYPHLIAELRIIEGTHALENKDLTRAAELFTSGFTSALDYNIYLVHQLATDFLEIVSSWTDSITLAGAIELIRQTSTYWKSSGCHKREIQGQVEQDLSDSDGTLVSLCERCITKLESQRST
ncbi:MAG: tetratricopeptide repeat protein [bacterium]|nr:tetratricopeptide repeat protein [bacterium]